MSVEVLIGGTDYWSDIIFSTARFVSQVNASPGEAKFRVRDLDRTKSFTAGQPVILRVDGSNVWRGFIVGVNRVYIAPAFNVSDFGLARFIDITCVDVNILLRRRFVFKQSAPAEVLAPLYGPYTADTTAIAALFAGWLDLTGDGLDTSTYVENVGDINADQEARAWEGGDEWGQAMASIASLPAAIYYIDPDLNFVYTDVDTPNAAYAMSDQPDGVTSVGYREMEILMDGGGLANDVLAWGAGYGSDTPVFVRDQDATSQAEHGLWQVGVTRFGVYKQATINRIAESIIDGSPQSKRGAKNDKVAAIVTTYTPGFLPAQKIDFTSNVFGFNDVIPIRIMETTFEAPNNPKYTLTLSHEIDVPFGFIDPFILQWPDIRIFIPEGWRIPRSRCPNGCIIMRCAYDDFNRVVSAPDWGGYWVTSSSSAAGGGITGGVPNVVDTATWNISESPTTQVESAIRRFDLTPCTNGEPWDYYVSFTADAAFNSYEVYNTVGTPPPGYVFFPANYVLDNLIAKTVPQQYLQFWFESQGHSGPNSNNPTTLRIAMDSTNGGYWTLGDLGGTGAWPTPTAFSFSNGATYKVRVRSEDGAAKAKLWNAVDPEPGSWAITRSDLAGSLLTPTAFGVQFTRGMVGGTALMASFTIDPVQIDLVCGDFITEVGGVCTVGADTVPRVYAPPPSDPTGRGCENPSRISGFIYRTSVSYIPFSTLVWRNGILQRRFADYTETPSSNDITFDEYVLPTDIIRVCYYIAEAP